VLLSRRRARACDVVVCDGAVGRALAVLCLLVFVWVWVFKNDVPGVEEARQEAETAERDVDERVGTADAALYPDCGRELEMVHDGSMYPCMLRECGGVVPGS
jgi:hypothetical protein